MSEWDARYAAEGWAFGTEPNDFLAEVAARIPAGPVLCLAEGQGRNAVFLAARGHEVTAMDGSAVALAGAAELARSRGVELARVHADLAEFAIGEAGWSGIVSIFVHLPPGLRADVHRRVVAGLRPGGVFVLEAYRPEQLAYGTGGPPHAERLPTLAELRDELAGLELEIGRELVRDVREGTLHGGPSAVVQVVARRPARGGERGA